MQAQKEQVESTSKFMKDNFGNKVLTKDPRNRHERRKDEAFWLKKQKKLRKKAMREGV